MISYYYYFNSAFQLFSGWKLGRLTRPTYVNLKTSVKYEARHRLNRDGSQLHWIPDNNKVKCTVRCGNKRAKVII